MNIEVNGQMYEVKVSYGDAAPSTPSVKTTESISPVQAQSVALASVAADLKEIIAPLEGKFYLTRESSETAIKVGDKITKGQTVGYIEAMKVSNAITADEEGVVVEICFGNGDEIEEDDVIVRLK